MSSATTSRVLPVSYLLPYRSNGLASSQLVDYINGLADHLEVIVIDGSDDAAFGDLASRCDRRVRHQAPHRRFAGLKNGKVRGVLTGLCLATHEHVIIADDDVRHTSTSMAQMAGALELADVVIPQNYFHPMPWHAVIDTARTLINRMTGGDWPGTLGVRRSSLARLGGYDGDVLFENLELVRTVAAGGGTILRRPDLYVRRRPPSTQHFWSQRIRQAYDEFARPARLILALSIVPLFTLLAATEQRWVLLPLLGGTVIIAELGRRRAGGRRVFPMMASLCAPVWLLERGVCAWLALGARAILGGIPYSGGVITNASNSPARLARRLSNRRPTQEA